MLFFLAVVVAAPAAAQEGAFRQVDCVAAVVGDAPIPCSRVEEELNILRQQGTTIPSDSVELARLRREVLDELINEELLIQAARRDTAITVTEQEVQGATDRAIREIRAQFGSDLEFERQLRAAGFASPDDYRRWLADQKRRELLRTALVRRLQEQGVLEPLPPTEAELRAAFERTRAQQPRRPAAVSFRQLVIPVRADSGALAEAYRRADSLRAELRRGAEFETLARRFSADSGSRERGGDLGWVRRGTLVKEFEQVAFQIRSGVISPPVRTPFGYHLIQVQRATPSEVQVRHILVAPTLTDADRRRARQLAEEVAQALRQGASFDSLAGRHHDQDEESLVEDVPRDRLPPAYQTALAGQEPGAVVGPVELEGAAGRTNYAVLVLHGMRSEGEYTFEDLRDQLRGQLTQGNALERYLRKLREATYITIRI